MARGKTAGSSAKAGAGTGRRRKPAAASAAKPAAPQAAPQASAPSVGDGAAGRAEALAFHVAGRPGKLEIAPTKPLTTQQDLSLAYSPGVAWPCLAIRDDPATAYDYTARGNMVAVISNGTAVLGLGNLGALASKPVMEGKAVLFKRFADVDAIDLELATEDVDEFVAAVRYLGPTFAGINLEDIAAPACFLIEDKLREVMDIPVFHDDQHGTAIIIAAGLINATDLTDRKIGDCRIVVNGAGAAAIASMNLLHAMGVRPDHTIMCDSAGVIYKGRSERMNRWKEAFAVDTNARTLADALDGADIFIGLSVKDAVSREMVARMAERPIIFALANPDPEIRPDDARAVRPGAIVATGRSDYPNQINNVLGFPYIFRGALDVRARTINDAMKIAAAEALAALARQDVPDEVDRAYGRDDLRYGPGYLVPTPFDPRLMTAVPPAVARAAMESGVARKPLDDMTLYRRQLASRLDPTIAAFRSIYETVRRRPRRVVFAEGEEERSIRAAIAFREAGYGVPVLLGRADRVAAAIADAGLDQAGDIEVVNARLSEHNESYIADLYARGQRDGVMLRDARRLVNHDRNVFAAAMVQAGHADAMVTGLTRGFLVCYDAVARVIAPKPGHRALSMSILVARGRTVFVADTNVHELPSAEEIADIAIQTAARVRAFGQEPRVALLSAANFGNQERVITRRVRDAVRALEARRPDFEFDGEMGADIALDARLMRELYPFCRLTDAANVLIMPGVHAANIATKMVPALGAASVIGPVLDGLSRPVQIVNMGASVTDLVNGAALAAHEAAVADMPPAP
ncbi:MAG: NADP-dependent malic enzyme [Alphaproteobacteria bacterium]